MFGSWIIASDIDTVAMTADSIIRRWYALLERSSLMAVTTTVNPSEETITIGPLSVHFLLTGEDTNGSISVFEVMVPA